MATYTINLLPTKTLHFQTPHKLLLHKDPDYRHLRVFGCLRFPNLFATIPHKLSRRTTPCVFMGYTPLHRGYRCLDISNGKIIISRHVMFDENTFPFKNKSNNPISESYDFLNQIMEDSTPLISPISCQTRFPSPIPPPYTAPHSPASPTSSIPNPNGAAHSLIPGPST